MKFALVCVLVVVAIVSISEAGPIERAIQRRIDRLDNLIKVLNDRDKTLVGAARDANRANIQRFRDMISGLRKGEDDKDGDGTTDAPKDETKDRRRRAAEDDKKDEKKDDDKKDEPGFVTRRINRLRDQISTMEKNASTLTGRARDLLFKQIDLQRALLDRLLRRPVSNSL